MQNVVILHSPTRRTSPNRPDLSFVSNCVIPSMSSVLNSFGRRRLALIIHYSAFLGFPFSCIHCISYPSHVFLCCWTVASFRPVLHYPRFFGFMSIWFLLYIFIGSVFFVGGAVSVLVQDEMNIMFTARNPTSYSIVVSRVAGLATQVFLSVIN